MRNKRGFTLIELLVVIAIIAILAAILFPVFAQAREKARQSACQSNLKQIGTAFQMYCSDYEGYWPYYPCGGTDQASCWDAEILPYVASAAGMSSTQAQKHFIYCCPSKLDQVNPNSNRSYVADMFLGLYRTDVGGGYCIQQQDDIKNGSEKFALLFESPTCWKLFGTPNNGEYTPDFNFSTKNLSIYLGFPHNDRMNILFADSHVSAKSLADLQAPGVYYFMHKCP